MTNTYKLNSMGKISPYMTKEDWKEIEVGPWAINYHKDYTYYCSKCKISFDTTCKCVDNYDYDSEPEVHETKTIKK
tara:strand:+ start:163 stop:390 length:228 start_codon:yes stop_codon:yes gene_type:complete